MSKLNISGIIKVVQAVVKKHSPEILTGLGIAGMVTTTVVAVKATPKAIRLLEEAERRKIDDQLAEDIRPDEVDASLTPVEVVKETWKCYVPAALVGAASVCCLIGASSVNLRRNAALATAYALSESALKEYREKVVAEIGEKKEQTVRDAVAKERLDKTPVTTKEVLVTGKGDSLCFDAISSRYFYSSMDTVKRAENELNRRMRDEMYISLNEFYYELGLEGCKIGDDLGWNIDKGYINIDYRSKLTDDGRPCLVLDYELAPTWDFR